MKKLVGGSLLLCVTLLGNGSGFNPLKAAHGPIAPPDDGAGLLAHGPIAPPDDGAGLLAHGPIAPPDDGAGLLA